MMPIADQPGNRVSASGERMNSPLEIHEVRLRGLGGPTSIRRFKHLRVRYRSSR
jgi:hypothetical protein